MFAKSTRKNFVYWLLLDVFTNTIIKRRPRVVDSREAKKTRAVRIPWWKPTTDTARTFCLYRYWFSVIRFSLVMVPARKFLRLFLLVHRWSFFSFFGYVSFENAKVFEILKATVKSISIGQHLLKCAFYLYFGLVAHLGFYHFTGGTDSLSGNCGLYTEGGFEG